MPRTTCHEMPSLPLQTEGCHISMAVVAAVLLSPEPRGGLGSHGLRRSFTSFTEPEASASRPPGRGGTRGGDTGGLGWLPAEALVASGCSVLPGVPQITTQCSGEEVVLLRTSSRDEALEGQLSSDGPRPSLVLRSHSVSWAAANPERNLLSPPRPVKSKGTPWSQYPVPSNLCRVPGRVRGACWGCLCHPTASPCVCCYVQPQLCVFFTL